MEATDAVRPLERGVVEAGRPDAVPGLSVALVATKLSPPASAPWLLPRTDLVAELTTASGKLCLISAPAGWGKTSLLTAWHTAETEQRSFAFLYLEPGDDDGPTFWSYLIAAIRTIHPEIMEGADEVLRTPGVEPMRTIVPQLLNELCEINSPMVLVLDDYHVLTQERIHTSILYLIDHLPPSLRLVIATRSDPPLRLGRLRASGELTEVRAARLRLSEEETSQLLFERFGVALDPQSVHLLNERTEGWPAALHLAGLSLQGEQDRRAFVERFAGDDRNIADYLTGEVLDRLPTSHTEFLLQTSVLDHLTGPLCDVVAGVSGSAAILEELERRNLFLIPLDNRRCWYRYHHLFGEWLRHELHRTEPNSIPVLHSRASRWYAENDSLGLAISHAIAASDHAIAADLMNRHLANMRDVRWSTLWRWLFELPDELVADYPMIAAARVVPALARGDFSDGLRWIGIAESAIAIAPDELRPGYETTVAFYRAFCEFAAGDKGKAQADLDGIVDELRLARSGNYPIAIGLAGIATFWCVGALEAIPVLREAAVARERTSLPDGGVTALLAAAYAETGDLAGAEATAEAALALPPPWANYNYPDLMAAHYALGMAHIARGEHGEGIAEIEQGLDLARRWVEPIFIAYGCLALTDALDGYAEKRALVREARQLTQDSRDPGRVGDLVTAAERKLSMRQPSQRAPGTVHVEPLTDREHDVLRLLNSELSLRAIANEMYISYNTVKGYTKSIYRKLGVSCRAAALDAARELDIT